MRWKEIVRDYFTFSRKESIAVVVILVLLFFVIILPGLLKRGNKDSPIADNSWVAAVKQLEQNNDGSLDSTQASNVDHYQYERRENNYPVSSDLFYFDPNTIIADQWRQLGLRDKTIQTIQNYLAKGGQFKRKEDLQKIYGLRQNEYEKLEPYIRISPVSSEPVINTSGKVDHPATIKEFEKKSHHLVDINTADTAAFIQLPGIGGKLAMRILNFRDKLGGFYAIEQIKETYGLPDSTYQKIKTYLRLENITLKRINLNTASLDELKTHPYIKYTIANAIIAYRNEHGQFSTIADLKKIMLVTDEVFQKIEPYLTLNL